MFSNRTLKVINIFFNPVFTSFVIQGDCGHLFAQRSEEYLPDFQSAKRFGLYS